MAEVATPIPSLPVADFDVEWTNDSGEVCRRLRRASTGGGNVSE
jgi:hypothetical protein